MRHDDHLGRMLAVMDIDDPDYYSHLDWWLALDKRRRLKNAKRRVSARLV